MSQSFPHYDRRLGLYYKYDVNSDSFVYTNGTRLPRPTNVDPPETPRYVGADHQQQGSASVPLANTGQSRAPPERSNNPPAASRGRDSSYTYGTPRMAGSPPQVSVQQSMSSRPPGARDGSQQDARDLSRELQGLNVSSSSTPPTQAQRLPSTSSQTRPAQSQYPQMQQSRTSSNTSQQGQRSQTAAGTRVQESNRERIVDIGGLQVLEVHNPNNDVRTMIASSERNPSQRITDPVLLQSRIAARGLLIGNGREVGEAERLYSAFRVRPHSFFSVGRVFLVLWVEPAGATAVTNLERNDILPGRFENELIYSKVRRFVVIRAGEAYCSALPVASYGHRGVGKPGVNKSEHAIIYTGTTPPAELASERPSRGENGMRHNAIRVVPDDPTDKLDPVSRIDFGKVSTVQHNVKVKPFGQVHPASMNALTTQFTNVWYGEALASAIRTNPLQTTDSASVPLTAYREAPPQPRIPIQPLPRPTPAPGATPAPQGRASAASQGSGSVASQRTTDAAQRPPPGPASSANPSSTRTSASSSRVATSTARASNRGRTQTVEEESSEDEDPRNRAVSTRGAQNVATSADGLAMEARSVQNAYQRLRQSGSSAEDAVELLARRFMGDNPGCSREEAGAAIRRRLRYGA